MSGSKGEKQIRVTYKMRAKLLRLAEYAECQFFSIIASNAELFLSGLNRRFFHFIYLRLSYNVTDLAGLSSLEVGNLSEV